MNKSLFALFASAGVLSASWAQTTIIDTDFTSPEYTQGTDIIGQNGWAVAPNTGVNAFNITNDSADTVSSAANYATNTGNFAYLPSVSVASAADIEWIGSMQFSASLTGTNYGAGDIFRVGTSSDISSTTGLVSAADTDVYLRVNRASNGRIRIQAHDASGDSINMIEVQELDVGWNVASNDFTSDTFVLDWNVRQTREADIFRISCTLSNVDSGASYESLAAYVEESAAYAAASSRFVIGHAGGASYNLVGEVYDLAHISIDSLSFIENTSIAPSLDQPVVSVSEGDTVVDLSWVEVVEAESYDVKRSDSGIGGPYVIQVSGLTTNGWQDTGLTNGDEYYYIVVAKATGASDVESDSVLASPFVPVTGTFLDTSFTAVDGYVLGDLAGQNRWKAIEASDPMAFNVDTNGSGYAENESYSNNLTGVARQVFYNKPTYNGEGHIWEGTLDFTLKAASETGIYSTNTYTAMVGTNTVTITNIQEVASLTANEALLIGITSDADSVFQPKGNDDAALVIKYTGAGDITFGLNQYNATANLMLSLPRETVGWDPQWQDQPASNGPIFETDPITLDWNIRKATVTNTYSAQVIATIGGNSYTSIVEYTDAGDTKNRPEDLYASELVRFVMGQEVKSDSEQVYAIIDAVSVTHSDTSDVPVGVPTGLGGVLGNLTVNLTWDAGGEQDSFNIYRSETIGGPYTFVANVIDQAFADSGLTDLRTYFYVVSAIYGVEESAGSDELIIRALGINNPLSWGLSANINGGGSGDNLTGSSSVNNGTYIFRTGNGIDGSWVAYADLIDNGGFYDTSEAPLIYGNIQQAADAGTTYIQLRHGIGTGGTDTLRIKADDGASNTPGSKMFWTEGDGVDAENSVIPLEMGAVSWNGTVHAVIRNGSQWYASEDTSGFGTGKEIKDHHWATFTPATASSTQLVSVAGPFVSGDALNLTDVNAVGFISIGDNHVARNWDYWKISVGTSPSAYDNWSDSYGIYNEDAALTNDFDLDGANNVWEWGLGGDPTDVGDVGITERFGGIDGTNFVYIYPRLKDVNARPTYEALETDNLLYTEFANQEGNYTITYGGEWPGEPDFEAVTNEIPAEDAVKFIKLNIK